MRVVWLSFGFVEYCVPIANALSEQLVGSAVAAGRLCATTDAELAVMNSELSLICVDTPSASNGNASKDYVASVCTRLGDALATSIVPASNGYEAVCW